MHKRNLTALLLAAAVTAGLCAGTVLAGGDEAEPGAPASEPLLISPAPSAGLLISPAPNAGQADQTGDESASAPAGEVVDEQGVPHTSIITEDWSPYDEPKKDPQGTLSFDNVEPLIRANNLSYLSLEDSIGSFNAMDYDELEATLKKSLRMVKAQQDQMAQLAEGTEAAIEGLKAAGTDLSVLAPALTAYPNATLFSLSTQVASLEASLKDLENNVIKDEYRAAIRQLTNLQDQIVFGGQTLYITLLGLDQTAQSLHRQLASLDRTIQELDLRYEMGQISALTLAEAKAGRTSLSSGIQTLDMNRTGLKRQLEAMVGMDITGTVQLQPLHAVRADQLAPLNLEKDLEQGMKKSYDVYAARKAVGDADDDLAAAAHGYERDMAQYAMDAAELGLEAAKQTFELSFTSLHDKLMDQQQVLNAARTTLAVKEDQLAAAQLKYEQGTISRNTLLSAQDARDDAQDTVDTAAVDLFTAYNNYCWAVDHGILN